VHLEPIDSDSMCEHVRVALHFRIRLGEDAKRLEGGSDAPVCNAPIENFSHAPGLVRCRLTRARGRIATAGIGDEPTLGECRRVGTGAPPYGRAQVVTAQCPCDQRCADQRTDQRCRPRREIDCTPTSA